VTVLPARCFPDVTNDNATLLEDSFTVPDSSPAEVPVALKGTTEGARANADSVNSLVPQDAPARVGPTTPEPSRAKLPTRHDPDRAPAASIRLSPSTRERLGMLMMQKDHVI
jgi:hypothetical protein